MTKEDKELLLVDLSGRLTCGVKVKFKVNEVIENTKNLIYLIDGEYEYITNGKSYTTLDIIKMLSDNYLDEIKPYLFPLSSMTGEQKREYVHIANKCGTIASSQLTGMTVQDWFNKNHFDYRGLIEKGLAIDATNLNIY